MREEVCVLGGNLRTKPSHASTLLPYPPTEKIYNERTAHLIQTKKKRKNREVGNEVPQMSDSAVFALHTFFSRGNEGGQREISVEAEGDCYVGLFIP